LIDDLLAFSRLGRQLLGKRETVDMDRLVRGVVEDLRPEREGRRVEIQVAELTAGEGDRALLRQVWTNLLSNAFKYTRKREVAIVEVGSSVEGGIVTYFVRDNGTGFDMRYAKKLFGVFQRLHRIEDFEGTGVGLAIVQRIVQRHGGRVWVEAAVDLGATFYFSLPKGATA
jgi:light-regulated signal transduction histidine kinase (bacteriophytochrome)